MNKITEKVLDFKTLEKIIYEIACRLAQEETKRYLEALDIELMTTRDTSSYRTVGFRTTSIKTVYGEVSYSRRYYKNKNGKYLFLLDEYLRVKGDYGLISENLAEQIINECSEKSFRKAAKTISETSGQPISAMGAWKVVQERGRAINRQMERFVELDEIGSYGHLGNLRSRVLFEEYDDVWLSMQSEMRRKSVGGAKAEPRRKIGMKPMHVGIAYTGWSGSNGSSFRSVNKIAYASFGKTSEFTSRFESLLNQRFDLDGVEHRLTNGDGEQWIRSAAEKNDSILQLDSFHRSQAILKAVSCKEERRRLYEAFAERDVSKILDIINELRLEEQDEPRRKKLDTLYSYFHNNSDSLLTWQERGIELPPAPEGMVYRNMGVQESSNCNIITLRMKNRKGSWSEAGGNNMASILCFRNTIGLDSILRVLPEVIPAESYPEALSAAKTPKHDGKGYGANWLQAPMPFEGSVRTNARKAIRAMLSSRLFSELSFK